MNWKVGIILSGVITVLFAGLIWFGLSQYKGRIKAEQSLSEAQKTITIQQEYIEQKDKRIKEIESEYRKKLEEKPSDFCGDFIVPDNIKNWLQGI